LTTDVSSELQYLWPFCLHPRPLRRRTKVFKNGSKEFTVFAQLTKPSQTVLVIVSSVRPCLLYFSSCNLIIGPYQDTHAGCTIQAEYKPKVPPSQFPVPDTRPITSTVSLWLHITLFVSNSASTQELDIAGLEDDPDFWKMSLDSSDDVRLAKPEPVSPTVQKTSGKSCPFLAALVFTQASVEHRTESEPANKDNPGPPPPRKMANGNYECNHTCNDKSKCRHYW
jgi:ATP-dependent DNA helicase HFM1/MER3